jgi:hypothetical protein
LTLPKFSALLQRQANILARVSSLKIRQSNTDKPAMEQQARIKNRGDTAAVEEAAVATEERSGSAFFDRYCEERPEIVEGLLREGDLAAFAGSFGMGKTPVLADLALHLVNGLNWCGRRVAQRPVILIDCETPGSDFRKTIKAIASRLGVSTPVVPDELDVYLERDDSREKGTAALLSAVSKLGHSSKLNLIAAALRSKPNAVVFIDPLEMLFRLDTCKKDQVMPLYRELRNLQSQFSHAVILNTFNLRKRDTKVKKAELLSGPREWLQEVCGSLDLLNRCDVRLGIDTPLGNDDVRVINGIVRGREMQALLIRPAKNASDELAGFEQARADEVLLKQALTLKQRDHWDSLPREFRFESVADTCVPRASLSRIINTVLSLGALVRGDDGTFKKLV